jgi:phosphohistidine phosphatase
MRLYILRHADAETEGRMHDADRKLTPEGIAEAEYVAGAARALKLNPTAILGSPTARAKATAQIIAKQFPPLQVHSIEQLGPAATPEDVFQELRSYPRDSRILLVSHKPLIVSLIASLVGMTNESKVSVKKASLACIDVGSTVQRGAGVLLWLLTSEQMQAMRKEN